MKAYFSFLVKSLIICGSVFASDAGSTIGADHETIFLPVMTSAKPIQDYKSFKEGLYVAIRRNDVPTIAVLYLIFKTYEKYDRVGAAVSGVVAGASIILLPFTFGLSTILLLPSAGVCAGAAVGTDKYKKLKKIAKIYLQKTASLSEDAVFEIRKLKNFNSDVGKLKNILLKDGFAVRWSKLN